MMPYYNYKFKKFTLEQICHMNNQKIIDLAIFRRNVLNCRLLNSRVQITFMQQKTKQYLEDSTGAPSTNLDLYAAW